MAKRKGSATREVSRMRPREPQLSGRAAIVRQRSSKEEAVQGGRPGREQSPRHARARAHWATVQAGHEASRDRREKEREKR